jgi:hypothetical protein
MDLQNVEPLGPCETCGTEVYLIDRYGPGDPAPLLGRVMVDLLHDRPMSTQWGDHVPRRCLAFRAKNQQAS